MPEKTIHRGECVGGPLDGREMESRFPLGFIVVDRANGKACIYRWESHLFGFGHSGHFEFDESAGVMSVDEEKHWKTAEGADFDVRAMPDGAEW